MVVVERYNRVTLPYVLMEKTKGTPPRKTVKVKCPDCGHVQVSGSTLQRITCSSCQTKFKREENILPESPVTKK